MGACISLTPTVGTRKNATKILAIPAIMSLRILPFYEKLPALNALLIFTVNIFYQYHWSRCDAPNTIFVFFVRIIM